MEKALRFVEEFKKTAEEGRRLKLEGQLQEAKLIKEFEDILAGLNEEDHTRLRKWADNNKNYKIDIKTINAFLKQVNYGMSVNNNLSIETQNRIGHMIDDWIWFDFKGYNKEKREKLLERINDVKKI